MSARAAAVAVADHLAACGVSLPYLVMYVAETYALLGEEPPLCHRHSIARARREIGLDGEAEVQAWVHQYAAWIAAAGAVLESVQELDPEPVPVIPLEAQVAALLAEIGVSGRDLLLAEVAWFGACARSQWLSRYWGGHPGITRICGMDPIANAAHREIDPQRCREIAGEVHKQMPGIAKSAEEIANP